MKRIKSYEIEQPQYARTPPKPLLIPHWIKPIIALNGLTISTLKDFKTLQQYLSRDMMLDFCAVNRFIPFPIDCYMAGFEKTVYRNTTDWYTDKEIESRKDEVLDQLTAPESDENLKDVWRFEDLDEEVFLIYVEPGFMNRLGFRDGALAFVSECLKTQYRYSPLNEVAKSSLYRTYLNLLNEKVPFNMVGSLQ